MRIPSFGRVWATAAIAAAIAVCPLVTSSAMAAPDVTETHLGRSKYRAGVSGQAERLGRSRQGPRQEYPDDGRGEPAGIDRKEESTPALGHQQRQ